MLDRPFENILAGETLRDHFRKHGILFDGRITHVLGLGLENRSDASQLYAFCL